MVDNSVMQNYPLLLFGGEIEVQHESQIILVDQWIKFSAPARIAVLIKEIRNELERLLEEKIKQPSLDISNHVLIETVTQLLSTDGL